MRLAQFFCTSTSQDLSVSFHLSALITTSRSHRAASTIHSTGRAEFLLLGTCRGPSGSYSSWQNCFLQQLFFYSTRTHIYRLLLQGPQDIERILPVLFHSHLWEAWVQLYPYSWRMPYFLFFSHSWRVHISRFQFWQCPKFVGVLFRSQPPGHIVGYLWCVPLSLFLVFGLCF